MLSTSVGQYLQNVPEIAQGVVGCNDTGQRQGLFWPGFERALASGSSALKCLLPLHYVLLECTQSFTACLPRRMPSADLPT